MNKEEARQAAIEWLLDRTQYHFADSVMLYSEICCVDNNCFIVTLRPINKETEKMAFPFRKIKAPPKGTLIRVWDTFDGCSAHFRITRIKTSSGHLSPDGLKILDTENVAWDCWELVRIVKIYSEYNNIGENNE